MSLAAIRGRMASVSLDINLFSLRLAEMQLNDPHAALGVSGRRLQLRIEADRIHLATLRDQAVLARRIEKVA